MSVGDRERNLSSAQAKGSGTREESNPRSRRKARENGRDRVRFAAGEVLLRRAWKRRDHSPISVGNARKPDRARYVCRITRCDTDVSASAV